MFTGIIEAQGRILNIRKGAVSARLTIAVPHILQETALGDSIAVNGVCLTAADLSADSFAADVMAETMRRSNLGLLRTGSLVNCERALTLNSRLGGHLVSGHIDGTGTVLEKRQEDNAVWFKIACGSDLAGELIPKGSIAIDGISLTVVAVGQDYFTVSIIPHTMTETTLGASQPGTVVNLEPDLIGKYVKKHLAALAGSSDPKSEAVAGRPEQRQRGESISLETLAQNGFF